MRRVRAWRGRTSNRLRVLRYWREAGTDEILWLVETIGRGYGHLRSVREASAVAADGAPRPWYTYPALEYLVQFDFSHWNAFEYGGGNGSLYWSTKCQSVDTVESDPEWHARIVDRGRPNLTVALERDPKEYAAAVRRRGERYPLIIIDGQHRRACAEHAVECFDERGLIILDNSDWWPQTSAFLRAEGFLQVDFTGAGPINRYTWTTSIFFRGSMSLELAQGRQPLYGVNSIHQTSAQE